MPATAAAPPAPPPPPRRRRVYASVDPRCEWARTEHDDTLVVDVSGFRKEELRVLYSTNRKLKVTGARQVDGAQWVRFVKVFPVPKSCDAGAIRARMNINSARLYVLLPKRSPSSPSSKDKESEQQSIDEHKGQGSAGSSSRSNSSGSLLNAREDAETDRVEEKEQRGDQGMEEQKPAAAAAGDRDRVEEKEQRGDQGVEEQKPAAAAGDRDRVEEKEQRGDQGVEEQKPEAVTLVPQDSPKRSDGDANDAERNDGDGKGDSKKWWRKITAVHVLGFVLILALVGVGATLLYVMWL